jgi:hypothetical protein
VCRGGTYEQRAEADERGAAPEAVQTGEDPIRDAHAGENSGTRGREGKLSNSRDEEASQNALGWFDLMQPGRGCEYL